MYSRLAAIDSIGEIGADLCVVVKKLRTGDLLAEPRDEILLDLLD
jgi:hypothetical protein